MRTPADSEFTSLLPRSTDSPDSPWELLCAHNSIAVLLDARFLLSREDVPTTGRLLGAATCVSKEVCTSFQDILSH